MNYWTNSRKAQRYISRASHISSLVMMDLRPMDLALQDYKDLLEELEQESESVQLLFALMVQDRTDIAIKIYYQMSRKSEDLMIELLPANLTMTALCYKKTQEKLGPLTNSRIQYLAREFNKLPIEHPDNPRKTFQIYKNAFKR